MSSSYILKNQTSVQYETGYGNDNCIFLTVHGDNYLITDGRYSEEARLYAKNCEIIEEGEPVKKARQLLRRQGVKKLFYDPLEWSVLEFEKLSFLKSVFFTPKPKLSQQKRIVKSDSEIAELKNSVKTLEKMFDSFADFVRQNPMSEVNEKNLNFKAKEILTAYGEYELSFEPITALGENSALPHARPTEKRLCDATLLLFDAGIKYNGYCSDRTRTLSLKDDAAFGYNQKFSNQKMQEVYELVLSAHDKAIEAAKAGIKAKELDKVARDIIEKGGYGKYFSHSLGHGVGLDIHELPVISHRSETVLEDGMVFTIEPGIYLPGEFGVRIEDMVVIKNGSVEIL